ncbi:MAG: hypothetical protein MZW92_18655 [Comamonadaceae bacterium]|nr:hypothetical protein [Comamonadaceae bacterium]
MAQPRGAARLPRTRRHAAARQRLHRPLPDRAGRRARRARAAYRRPAPDGRCRRWSRASAGGSRRAARTAPPSTRRATAACNRSSVRDLLARGALRRGCRLTRTSSSAGSANRRRTRRRCGTWPRRPRRTSRASGGRSSTCWRTWPRRGDDRGPTICSAPRPSFAAHLHEARRLLAELDTPPDAQAAASTARRPGCSSPEATRQWHRASRPPASTSAGLGCVSGDSRGLEGGARDVLAERGRARLGGGGASGGSWR